MPPLPPPDRDPEPHGSHGGSSMYEEEAPARTSQNFKPRLKKRREASGIPRPPARESAAQLWNQQYVDRGSFELVCFEKNVDLREQVLEGISKTFEGLGLTLPRLNIVIPSRRELKEYADVHAQFYDGENLDLSGFREALDDKYANPAHRILAVVPGFTGCDLGESSNLQMGAMVVSIDQVRSAPRMSLIEVVTHEETHVLLGRGHHAEEDVEVFEAGMVSDCVLASTYGKGKTFCDLCKKRARVIEEEDRRYGLV